MPEYKIMKGNCLDLLNLVPDNFVDISVTSPPYNMNLRIRGGKFCSRQIVKEITTKYKNFDDNLPMDDYYEFNKEVINGLLRVTKNQVFYNVQFLTGNKSALFRILGHFHNKIKEFIIWDKVNAEPSISKGVLNSRFEVLMVFDDTNAISRRFENARFDRGTIQNLWRIKRGKKRNKEHGAVFPLELSDHIIRNFTGEGDIVLDPFTGTGTTAESALSINRHFLGMELDEDYFNWTSDHLFELFGGCSE